MNLKKNFHVPRGEWQRWPFVFGALALFALFTALGPQIARGTAGSSMFGLGPVSQPSESARDSDVPTLASAASQALQRAHAEAPDAVLREVVTDLTTTTFRFTDVAATKEINVYAPGVGVAAARWNVSVNLMSPFVGRSEAGMKLDLLRIGPHRVAKSITDYWPGCKLSHLILYVEGDKLVWLAYCDTAEGLAMGSMDNQTGIFQPSGSPAIMPSVATPAP